MKKEINFFNKKYHSIKNVLLNFGLQGFYYYILKSLKLINEKKIDFFFNKRNIPELQKIRINLNN